MQEPEYKIAALSKPTKEQILKFESKLNEESGRPIVLIAYEAAEDGKSEL